jgi:hypothetical protein
MKKITTAIIILFFSLLLGVNAYSNPADSVSTISKENLLKSWVLKEYKENGKTQELYDYEIEFFANGKYVETEDEETSKGLWELNDNSIMFDKNSLDQDEWLIVSFEPEKLIIKFSDEDKNYQFLMVPLKEK